MSNRQLITKLIKNPKKGFLRIIKILDHSFGMNQLSNEYQFNICFETNREKFSKLVHYAQTHDLIMKIKVLQIKYNAAFFHYGFQTDQYPFD